MTTRIEVSNRSTGYWVPGEALCQGWIGQTLSAAGQQRPCAVSLCFVDPGESADFNERYRRRNGPTDVLSFPCALPRSLGELLDHEPIGDIVVCAALAQQQAEARQQPLPHRWAHLLVHGCLHLLGFDHNEEREAARMEQMEIEILGKLGIPDPYRVS